MQARYTRTAMLLHWLVAVLLIGQFSFGWYLETIARGIPARGYFVNLHKSTGLLIGLLILLRIGWRLSHAPPPLPSSVQGWQRQAAQASHYLLYVLMLAMPLSGYIASNFSRFGVVFFNTVKLAPWGIDSKLVYGIFNQMHIVSSWLLLALVIVHVLAALKHLLVDHDSVFLRMVPQRLPARR